MIIHLLLKIIKLMLFKKFFNNTTDLAFNVTSWEPYTPLEALREICNPLIPIFSLSSINQHDLKKEDTIYVGKSYKNNGSEDEFRTMEILTSQNGSTLKAFLFEVSTTCMLFKKFFNNTTDLACKSYKNNGSEDEFRTMEILTSQNGTLLTEKNKEENSKPID